MSGEYVRDENASPCEQALAEQDHYVNAVVEAWTNAGSHPEYHEQMKRQLFAQWPCLAKAVERLASYAGPENTIIEERQ